MRAWRTIAAAALWAMVCVIPAQAETSAPRAEGSPDTLRVPMRDGTLLATDVYLPPDAPGPLPTILMRTPYNKSARWAPRMARLYNAHGYAFVVQDTRGRFASMGEDSLFLTDGVGPNEDGYDTIEWIVRQPWSNGSVGMVGESATGITSYLAAATGHPALKCAQVGYAVASLYDDLTYPGGVYRQGAADSWVSEKEGAEALALVYAHPMYDASWERVDLTRHAQDAHAAIYHWGGWFDAANRGTISAFQCLQERGGEGARGHQMLVMGPWSHGDIGRAQGELVFPPNHAAVNPQEETIAWFDLSLKGIPNALSNVPPVRYYLMGDVSDSTAPGNRWMSSSSWPPSEMRPVAYYLSAGGLLATQPPTTRNPPTSYPYDPKNPVPTRGGSNLPREGTRGPYDQREIERRPDVLTFSTPPLEEPVAVAGNVRVRLWASSSARDTDFMAKLCDVYPDGRSMLILDGAISARHRQSCSREDFLVPGQVYEFEIDLWNTALVFNRGHRIRVEVTSSNAPRYYPNPNTATPFHSDSVGVIATNSIYHNAAHPSALILPVIPWEGK